MIIACRSDVLAIWGPGNRIHPIVVTSKVEFVVSTVSIPDTNGIVGTSPCRCNTPVVEGPRHSIRSTHFALCRKGAPGQCIPFLDRGIAVAPSVCQPKPTTILPPAQVLNPHLLR